MSFNRKPKEASLSALTRKLDKVFSLFIRLRDSASFNHAYFRCIACNQIKPFEQMDCGHFIGRTHRATRWDEDNCNGECRYCNRMSADHILYYQRNLIHKIGQDRVDLLLAKSRRSVKYSRWELEQLIKYYQDKVNEMQGNSISR